VFHGHLTGHHARERGFRNAITRSLIDIS